MRTIPEVKTYTFPNGTTVEYVSTSAYWQTKIGTQANAIMRPFAPTAPLYRNETTDKLELNTNDPTYQSAMTDLQYRWSMQKIGMLIAVSLKTPRADMETALGDAPALDPDDRAAFLAVLAELGQDEDRTAGIDVLMTVPAWELLAARYIAVVCCEYDSGILLEFVQVITGQRDMEADVQSAAESFSGDVPG